MVTVVALASDSARASAFAREVETVSRGTHRARARASMKVRCTRPRRRRRAVSGGGGGGGGER